MGIKSRGFEKEISRVEIILWNELLKLKYKDCSRYESNEISLHEFDIKSIADLILIDKMLSSDLHLELQIPMFVIYMGKIEQEIHWYSFGVCIHKLWFRICLNWKIC